MRIIPTILCGGAGSRLWPVSRERHPKPFIRLPDGQSFLQKALLRGLATPGVSDVLTVTNRELFFKTQDDYREINSAINHSYLLEPVGRNTAAAIATAALYVANVLDDETIILVLPADHVINDEPAFQQAVQKALVLAQKGLLVTFGIQPETPETGYGYIEVDVRHPLSDDQEPPFYVKKFVEKPDAIKAQVYLDSGNFLWNAGMFCAMVGTIKDKMNEYCPDIIQTAQQALNASPQAQGELFTQVLLDKNLFCDIPDTSFDYAVMEPSTENCVKPQVAVVPCSMGWSDVGSWTSMAELTTPDAQGNRIDGDAVLLETSNTYVQSRYRLTGVIGVDNLLIVDTPDALLISHKDHTQQVKQLYTQLKTQDHESHLLHRTVHRPWGTYTILEEGERFKIKRIEVKPGATLSMQMHYHRSEHWIVVSGMAKVTNGEQVFFVGTNESTYIPAGHKHRLENPGVVDLVMIEVQSGEYLGEDDIVRFADNYGRT